MGWSWRFFQKVRRFTFGERAPVTQHSWWEQTAMVYLLQFPFAGERAGWASSGESDELDDSSVFLGVAPALCMLDQRHINGYPSIVAVALKTHLAFEAGDYIISFSGCKIFSSQELCNALFLSYFVESVGGLESAHGIADSRLHGWLEK